MQQKAPGDLTIYPYHSSRRVVVGSRGAVATAQPQAALAGMEMLLKGGSAADAAVAMAAALTVLEPTSNGLGSDAFALVWAGQPLGLNASGRSPKNLDLAALPQGGTYPQQGWLPVTVPGAVSGWIALWRRFGKLALSEVLAPAIRYAGEGFALSPVVARNWRRALAAYQGLPEPLRQSFYAQFFPTGFSAEPGAIFRSPALANSLTEIAQSEGESFYRGRLAGEIAGFAAASGGYLTRADLAAHQAQWVEPLALNYRDCTVYELPPNGQGVAALEALGILAGFDLGHFSRDSVESFHLQIEAMKLALADAAQHLADPAYMTIDPEQLMAPAYLAAQRDQIGGKALEISPAGPGGGTVYLAAADGEIAVSFIQSNFAGFGSGVVVPGTGISLQNRGACFSLEAGHPNLVAPGKRPYHTIMPGFLVREGQPWGPFGVMGGMMQPQGHLQVVVNLVDYGLNPQAALDAPRFKFEAGKVWLEAAVPTHVAQGLADLGHSVVLSAEPSPFGRGQIILRQGQAWAAGSEPRADGLALAW